KQFLKIFDGESLFQKTIKRNKNLVDKIEVITNENQYFIALDQVEEMGVNPKFIVEEMGKNTAPAIAFGALESDSEDILFVTPSDHLIKNEEKYKESVNRAKELAKKGYLITFGINPNEANTGYGYIEANGEDVIKFHEKPDLKTAKEYLKKGNFYWNSGMFMFKAGVYLEELKKYNPKLFESVLRSYEKSKRSENLVRLKGMEEIEDISVDYALMEKSNKIKVVKSEFDWSDVGSFDSLSKEIKSEEAIEVESAGNFYYTDSNKVIATIGLKDYIIVDTKDALLISKKGESQKVREVVKKLKKEKQELLESHTIVHRPWGTYETLIEDNGYKVKKIVVKPGKRLSLQKHFHRNEHWIVVSGTAEVEVGDNKFILRPNESTYIKMGEKHRLSNPGKIPLVIIEVQVGEYTGEDDIVRIDDDYAFLRE
ncbi:MAG: mannose-1-phosphate guanylyltransferase/mannose-6-phosphate isomerase, partial [Nautiliaceae bacterium]